MTAGVRRLTSPRFVVLGLTTLLLALPAASQGTINSPTNSSSTNESPRAARRTPDAAQNPVFSDGSLTFIRLVMSDDSANLLRAAPRKYVRVRVESTGPGQNWQEAGIRLKGSAGSFQPLDRKPSFTIDFARFAPSNRFHGLSRLYLNNSVEDPGLMNEKLGAAMFHAAGVPTARVGFARVRLNDRDLGLYVLKEGFTREFLEPRFDQATGDIFDNDGGCDIDQRMHRGLGGKRGGSKPLPFVRLLSALNQDDPEARWRDSAEFLDRDEFLRFAAMEIILGHRDGYCLARNNYRIYVEPPKNRLAFIPDGMDQLLGNPQAAWHPHMAGLVASRLLASKEGLQQYQETLTGLLRTTFSSNAVASLVDGWVRALQPGLTSSELKQIRDSATALKMQAAQREHSLWEQLQKPPPQPLHFVENTSQLVDWTMVDVPEDGVMNIVRVPPGNGPESLHILANSPTAASWRKKVLLERGGYRFEGVGRVDGVFPLANGKTHGAALRIAGRPGASQRLTGKADWQKLGFNFQVEAEAEDVELMVELRAGRGEFWMDLTSLRLVRLPR